MRFQIEGGLAAARLPSSFADKLKMNLTIIALVALLVLVTGCSPSGAPSSAPTTTDGDSRTTSQSIGSPTNQQRSVVKLTDAAVLTFKEVLVSDPKKHIRLAVKGGGSTGFMYDLQIDDTMNDSDIVDDSNGFRLEVDPKSSIHLDGATIDWQTQADGKAGFKFDNPNALKQ